MIHTWDLETLEESGPTLTGHQSVIYDLAVGQYQGGTVLASVSFDQTVRLWDLGSRKQLGEPLRGHGSQVHAVAIGKWNARPVVFSGGMDGTIRMWDLETHAQIIVINVDSRVFSLKLIDQQVVVGCARGLATIEVR
jgi:WD40 repeat protein